MITNKKVWFFLILCILGIVFFRGRDAFSVLEASAFLFSADKKEELLELAYDRNPKKGYTVYLKEGDAYVPYLVVSSGYGGKALLLRRELLETTMPFNENESHMWARSQYGGYYEDSSIDQYLNGAFIGRFSQTVQAAIVHSDITITDKSSLGITGNSTIEISRKVFLLSLKELNGADSNASASEGETLPFFADDFNRRTAYLPNQEVNPYWTRTPETWETYTVFTIGPKGTGAGSADINSGVRPAFCLEGSTVYKQRSDLISGQTVFVIE
ncbi:DUF6273 domain-containing protein [Paenibacillus sp. FSL R7-0331]|uniref:DUF6273 domain-containing protein n=1 Tax=Paenibacillus sp. FSL R7-0331 TaxID=1536773 RepID=UPI0004F808E0|nr:DUF6273 domain-containing protein [Paenibacillus sp. FSL R7-0331]AIQ50635.1 hypothetical protein R70331_03175 [Paenibacillus sp. FSL R7-0331]